MAHLQSSTSDTFPERLKLVRRLWEAAQGREVTDQEFAGAIGMTPQNFSLVKNSLKPPPYERIRQIAQRAGVDPGWLMFGGESAAPAPAVPKRGITGTVGGVPASREGPPAVAAAKAARKKPAG